MTDADRECVQRYVDEARDARGVPSHGSGLRYRVRHDRGGHGLWVRVCEWMDPDAFCDGLAQSLGRKGWDVDIWLDGTRRHCRIDWKEHET